MSQASQRSAVFLAEMGIAPHWKLRQHADAFLDEAQDAAAVDAEVLSEMPASVPHAAETVHAAPVPSAPQAAAPAVQPAAPVAVPPAVVPAAAAPDDSTAWFDDAPTPAPAPVAAAPAPMRAPPPPSQPAAQRPAAPRAPAPQLDDSTAWFDDAPMPAPTPARAPAAATPAAGPVSDAAIAAMDWPQLQAAVKSCTRCELCHSRKAAVPGRGDPHAQWLVLAAAPSTADEADAAVGGNAGPLSAEAGKLLDNMLKAVDLSTAEGAYIGTLVKCRPTAADGSERAPSADEVAACRPFLDRELELSGARLLLAIGHPAGKGLLGAAARGKVLRYDGRPTVATYHPADLLRRPEDKGKAWADLCLARSAHAGRL
ncbi:uracil-DNA glycosylase family protein [Massilia sp. BJB1822]|uniref:uracil-DNA glycosylase n=1 Tax=Massilia sp. BJB1822 TaxID=2744470 RepID=UPI001592CE54|nr:uracil-DNA glycosylase [Massilia sp. BJB1822]NVE00318.1 uracil-DNA glycosylase [Massilia sp. BJB1822]